MPDEPRPQSKSFASAARLGAKAARLAAARKALVAENAQLKADLDALKARPDATTLEGKVKELSGTIRASKHRAAFAAAAAAAKVRGDAIDDLWELSKLDTSADEPDAGAIGAAIAEKTKARPYLLDGEASTTPAQETKAPLNPGPGSSRGARTQPAGMTVTRRQLADAEFMRSNQSRVGEASSQGLLTITE